METGTLFIHSTGSGPLMWSEAPEFPGSQRLLPSNLGYPPNAPLAPGQKVSAADDARALLPLLPEHVHIVAHSYGAVVALELLAPLGARARSLFLFEPVMFAVLPAAMQTFDPAWFVSDDPRVGTDEWLELFIDYWNRPGSWARMPEALRDYCKASRLKMVQEVLSCFRDVRSVTERPLPPVPTTLVTAERSTLAARTMLRTLADAYPHATVVDLPKTGHMAPLTHPAVVKDALFAHWQRVGA